MLAAQQARQLAAAYEKLSVESERHIRALQRSLTISTDERRETQRLLDETQLQLATTKRELSATQVEFALQQNKVLFNAMFLQQVLV